MTLYTKEWTIRMFGGSHGVSLTDAFKEMNLEVGDKVSVSVDENKILTIKKVNKK